MSSRNYPINCWYVAATSDEVDRRLLGRRLVDVDVAMYRTQVGEVVAFEDRCPHRAYPLSCGRLDGDNVVCGYHGFTYDPSGACVRVPSQEHVPYGLRARVFPVRERPPYVWIWLGEPTRAALRAPEDVTWLVGERWSVWGGEIEVEANYLLLHENFADVTHLPFVHPEVSPAVLRTAPPPLTVEVTERSVRYARKYPAAPLADWHARATGLAPDGAYEERESGAFLSPALWVDEWTVLAPDGGAETYSLGFAQAVTPVGPSRSRLVWRVGRNFATEDEPSLRALFTDYFDRVAELAELLQRTIDSGRPRRETNVSADAAALQVRRVVALMLAEEGGRAGRLGAATTLGL